MSHFIVEAILPSSEVTSNCETIKEALAAYLEFREEAVKDVQENKRADYFSQAHLAMNLVIKEETIA